MYRILLVMLALCMAALAGCSSLGCGDPHAYLNSPSLPPLKAPEGLSIPRPDPAYAINSAVPTSAKKAGRNAAGVCLINPPNVLPAAATTKPAASAAAIKSNAASPANSSTAKPSGREKTSVPAAGTSSRQTLVLATGGLMQ